MTEQILFRGFIETDVILPQICGKFPGQRSIWYTLFEQKCHIIWKPQQNILLCVKMFSAARE